MGGRQVHKYVNRQAGSLVGRKVSDDKTRLVDLVGRSGLMFRKKSNMKNKHLLGQTGRVVVELNCYMYYWADWMKWETGE